MITNVTVKNFRSIEDASIALAPITMLYGPTSSGKSSLLYAMLVLRNFVLNPNRLADGYFHLGFIDLGGFDECVFNHDPARNVSITVTHREDGRFRHQKVEKTGQVEGGLSSFTEAEIEDLTKFLKATYGLSFSKKGGTIKLEAGGLAMQAEIPIPYGLSQTFPFSYTEGDEEYSINWNGIACTVSPKKPTAETQHNAREIAERLNASGEVMRAIDIGPHRRGFFKPSYASTSVPVAPPPTTEDEVASIVINDPHMPARISVYAEEIFGRDFRLDTRPGTAMYSFLTTEKKSRIPVLLVNDGYGVNQVIYLLAKMNRVDVRTILIEEPEVHLHPAALRNFARTLCGFTKEEGKQVILTTHSEVFVSSILTMVAEGGVSPEDLKCYLVTKDKKSTLFRDQKVEKSGQVEGGLSSFMEAEIEDLTKFLGAR